MQETPLATYCHADGDSYWEIVLIEYKEAPDRFKYGYRVRARLNGEEFDQIALRDRVADKEGRAFDNTFNALWSAHHWVTMWLKKCEMAGVTGQESPLMLANIRLFSPFYGMEGPFYFNEHDCCLNPEKLTIIEGKTEITIKLAATPKGKWGYGFGVMTSTSGHSFSATSANCSYPNRETALVAGVQYAKRNSLIEGNPGVLKELDKLIGQSLQLSLF